MEAPPCQNCGKRHWSTQPCGAEPKHVSPPKVALRSLGEERTAVEVLYSDLVTAPLKSPDVTKRKRGRPMHGERPMTHAERQQAYRERKALQSQSQKA